MTAKPQVDPIDDLNQIRDELRVVWLALTSPEASIYVDQIGEVVKDLGDRVADVSERLISEKGA